MVMGAGAARQAIDWRLFAVMYGLMIVAFTLRTFYNAATIPLISDTDDAMRLVVVRDFLAGQGWYDNLQHRLNTPFGAEIHWSRLADLPLAGLILLFTPLFGAAGETVAAFVYPLLLAFFLLYLCARVALKLVGPEGLLPALALPVFSLSVLAEFAPGRVDHHSLQILLLLAMVWCSIEALARPRFAIGAGIAAATSIAVGIEGVPSVAAAILVFGLMWVADGTRAGTLRLFGLSFGLGTAAHLALALPPERWFVPACDAISVVYAAGGLGVAVVFTLLSLLPLAARSMWLRLGLGVVTGLALVAMLLAVFPQCLRGPYGALDPWLVTNWLDRITEARPFFESLLAGPSYPLSVAIPPLIAAAVIAFCALRGKPGERQQWLVYAVYMALAFATMLVQIRASRMLTVLAVPAGAWLIVAARQYYLQTRTLPRVVPLVLSWLGSAGIAVALVVMGITSLFPTYAASIEDASLGDRRQCVMPAAFAELAAMPPERVMTPIDLGAHMLAFTPHAVVSAPYHRNQQGVRDTFAFFNGPIEAARDLLDARGITLVVTCPALPELQGGPDSAPDSFIRRYEAGTLPGWLVDTSLPDAPLKVFAVMPR